VSARLARRGFRGALAGALLAGAAVAAPLPAASGRAPVRVEADAQSGTPRVVSRRDGFLTGPRSDRPRDVALEYVRGRPVAFALDSDDLSGLRLERRYTSGSGATHLQWAQTFEGVPAFGGGLRANVAADGRLINVGGAPWRDLAVESVAPRLGARDAVMAAARGVATSYEPGFAGAGIGAERRTAFAGRSTAGLVIFVGPAGPRLAWHVIVTVDAGHMYDAVIDAGDGELLFRRNLAQDATGLAYSNYPGAPAGGTQVAVNLDPWLSAANRLEGPFAHVQANPTNGAPETGDEIPPTGGNWNYAQTPIAAPGRSCPPTGCTWNGGSPGSWTTNRNQAGTQLFVFVNRFHDHLRDAAGIGFGASSGNFEVADPVLAEVDWAASLGCQNNAGMAVGPDGVPGLMQIGLWSRDCDGGIAESREVNAADDAYIVFHEYTHGLSFRLITRPDGVGALDTSQPSQSGAMAEAWSDWYAKDYLVATGLEADTAAPGELRAAVYENDSLRTQAFDCPVGAAAPACPGSASAGPGGYTYGDFGKVIGSPEIHADGEIWAETLWDLRTALIAAHGSAGVTRARALITDGMRLSPDFPTFLNMRDAIFQANFNRGYGDRDLLWAVFARRGMGVNAVTRDDLDTFPFEDFTTPPPVPKPPPPPAADTKAPVVSRLSMTRRRFRVGARRTARVAGRRPTPRGSAFRFRLSEPATAFITIERGLPGRRVGKSCRRPTRRLRSRKRCTRYVRKARLTRRKRKAGRNSVSFSGRIGPSALARGGYRATISATDEAGNRGKGRRTSFTIVRR